MTLALLLENEEYLASLASLELTDVQKAWNLSGEIDAALEHIKKGHDKRNALLEKFGTPTEDDPGKYYVAPDVSGEFEKAFTKLLAVDVTVKFTTLTLEDLQGQKVTPRQLMAWRQLGVIVK